MSLSPRGGCRLLTADRLAGFVAAAGASALLASCSTTSKPPPPPSTTSTQAPAAALCPAGVPAGGTPVTGPAATSLSGGAARTSFALDSGALRLDPPAGVDRPTVSASVFRCDLLSAIGADGQPLGSLVGPGGPTVGYARVTVDLPPDATPVTTLSPGGQWVQRPVPAPAVYRDRLAWVGVVGYAEESGCPAQLAGQATLAPDRNATDYGYEVFLVDAHTGGDGLVYTEEAPEPCGLGGRVPPAVAVPVERVSVPWTLVGRDPDGYSATITAQVLPCDSYPTVVDADGPVSVVAERPFGPPCGPPLSVPITLDAATVTSNLPVTLDHAPLGPSLAAAPSTPAPASRPILTLTPADERTTVTIGVGSVLVVGPPLVQPAPGVVNPATSSDPQVLGLLGPPSPTPIAEFRAWKAGHADLAVAGQWVIHVVVG
jgi:hypothetical protein